MPNSTHAQAYWRGTLTCARAAAMLDGAMAVLILQGHADVAAAVTLAQGSYRPWSKYSANTHAGCGVVDVSQWNASTGQRWTAAQFALIVAALRMVGFAAWHRALIVGLWVEHIHCVAIGCPDLNKPDATNQVTWYRDGQDGLASHGPDNGPRDWVNVTWETHQATPVTTSSMTITTQEELTMYRWTNRGSVWVGSPATGAFWVVNSGDWDTFLRNGPVEKPTPIVTDLGAISDYEHDSLKAICAQTRASIKAA